MARKTKRRKIKRKDTKAVVKEKPRNTQYVAILVIFLIISVLVSVFVATSTNNFTAPEYRPPPLPDGSQFIGPPDSSLPPIVDEKLVPPLPEFP